MKTNKILIISFFVCAFTVNAFGQVQEFSREQMIQDIDTLFSTIDKVHPDMYAVYPKQQLDNDIERAKSGLEPSGDIFYFYKQVAPLVAKLGDGHTSVFRPAMDRENTEHILFFPFPVKVTKSKVIHVQNDYTQEQNSIPIGAQIMRINNRDASDIVTEMMNYVSGEKDFYRIARLEWLFTPLLHTLFRDSIFDIEYMFNQKYHSISIKGLSYEERYERPQQSNSQYDNLYSFSILQDKDIGTIEFNSFSDLDRFKLFLDSTFQVLQEENIGNLIIDIRENGGGNSLLGDELFQYISPVPFAQWGKGIVKYSDVQKQYHKTNYDYEVTNPNGLEAFDANTLIELKENSLRYKGNVYLLISHSTFSSAASFSWAFQYFKMGTVIGEETGGLAVCFGDIITSKLPNSGLFYCISHKKFYQYGATDDNTHGTLPDYNVEAEKALDFTIDLITRKK